MGNLPTEKVLPYLETKGYYTGIELKALPELAGEAARLRLLYG